MTIVPSLTYEIEKRNIRAIHPRESSLPGLAPACIRVAMNRVALTANNVTYAASGDALRYWSFFPVAPGGEAGRGLVPVWGVATVIESKHDEFVAGDRIYGFLPLATHVDLEPAGVTAAGFADNAAHRSDLPDIYNRYQRIVGPLAELEPEMLDRYSLLSPLFATSFLLDDFLAEALWFEAESLFITSASSKTAIGLAHQTHQRATRPEIVGLTSRANEAFVASLGWYDRIVTYDNVPARLGDKTAIMVDLAGNTALRAQIHTHFGDRLRYSCAVGTSHWDTFNPADRPVAGPKPVFFFAPAQSKKRRQEWGGEVLQKKIFESWFGFARQSEQWLRVTSVGGNEAVRAAWQSAGDGSVGPEKGLVLALG